MNSRNFEDPFERLEQIETAIARIGIALHQIDVQMRAHHNTDRQLLGVVETLNREVDIVEMRVKRLETQQNGAS